MAYLTQSFDSFATLAGTLTVTLYYDSTISSGSVTFPDPFMPLTNVDEIIERCEDASGLIEIPTMDIELAESHTDLYPEGLWYRIVSDTLDLNVPAPELRLVLENGSAYSIPFWGTFDLNSVEFVEHHVGATVIRSVKVRLISAMYRIAQIDVDAFLTNLLAARGQEELPIYKPIPSAVYTGSAGSITFGYRVAARDANGEYLWSSETTVANCDDLDGSHYVDISWASIGGATSYSIYRTTVSSGPLGTGFIVNQSGVTYQDQGASAAGGTVQTKHSARKFVKYTDLFRYALVEAFGVSYGASLTPNMVDDVRMKSGATSLAADSEWFLYWRNTGDLTTPAMGMTPYFDSTDPEYFGSRYVTVLDLLGGLAKQFAHYPKFYDVATSAAPTPSPRIDLLARRQPLTTPTLDGNLLESSLWSGSQFVVRSIAAFRARHKDSRYTTNEGLSSFDLEIPCEFAITTSVSLPGIGFEEDDYEGIYWVQVGTLTTATLADGAEYYNGSSWVAAGTTNYAVRIEDGAEVLIKTPLQAALVTYFVTLTDRRSRMYERVYGTITSTASSVSTEKNTVVLSGLTLSDGISSRNYYINETRKNLLTDTLWLRLIEQ